MCNLTLKMRETILLFLSVAIIGLKCIGTNIELDTCIRDGEGGGVKFWN